MTAHSTPVHQRPAVAAAMATRNHSTPTRTRGPAMSGRTMNRPRPDAPPEPFRDGSSDTGARRDVPVAPAVPLVPVFVPAAFALPVLALAVLALAVLALVRDPGAALVAPSAASAPDTRRVLPVVLPVAVTSVPTGDRGKDRDLVGIADRGVALGGLAVDPHATDGEDLGEAVAEARRGPPEDLGDRGTRDHVARRAGGLPGLGEQTHDWHRARLPPGVPGAEGHRCHPGPARPRRPPAGARPLEYRAGP